MKDNNPVHLLGEAVANLEDLLLQNALAPDPERRNWAAFRRDLDDLESRAKDVAAALGPAWMFADQELRATIATRCAHTLLDAAVVLRLAARDLPAKMLLDRAADLARDGGAKGALREIDQAVQHPEDAVAECHHRWLEATGRLPDTEPRRPLSNPADIESPVSRAPALIRINGCGVGLYGHRDQQEDGSYLSAWCVSILFIPVFPIRWYRVLDSNGGYVFLGRRPLGFAGRLWQFSIAMTVMTAFLAWGKLGAPWGNADAKAELGRLSAMEADGGGAPEELLEGYLRVAQDHPDQTEGRAASLQAAKLIAARIPAPCKADTIEEVRQQGLRLTILPVEARSGKPEEVLRDALLRCAAQLPSESLDELEVLGIAVASSSDEKQNQALRERLRTASIAIGARVYDTDPMHAIALYRSVLPDPKAMDGMLQTFDSLPMVSSLAAAAEPAMQAWLRHSAGDPRWQTRAPAVRERLAAASQQHASWLSQIEEASDQELEGLFKQNYDVEELATAYARMRRGAGQPSLGVEALTGLRPEGRLTYESRIELASCYRDAKKLDQARFTLGAVIRELSRPYREAADRWRKARLAGWESLADQARKDRGLAKDADLPEDALEPIEKGLTVDPVLKEAAEEVDGTSIVVRAAVALASIDLAEGLASEGEQRARLLHDAEVTLLQMKAAEGDFDYDLQSGVVLHRVGKQQEAEAAFDRALRGADLGQTLKVARAYRSIGLESKARRLAESSYRMADEQLAKWEAAALRSAMWESLEDRKDWLDKCEPRSSKLERMQVEAQLALRRGADDEAAKLLAHVCSEYELRIGNGSVEANNAGLAFLHLYELSGDPAHLQKAVRALSRAAAMTPDAPIVLDNLADTLELQGTVEVLARWIHVRALRVGVVTARDLLDLLLDSELSREVTTAIRTNALLARSRQTREQYSVLAPHDRSILLTRISWARTLGDKQQVNAVLARFERLGADDSDSLPDAGAADAGAREDRAQQDAEERRLLERALKDGHGPTIAASSLLLARELRIMNRQNASAERTAELVRLVQQAAHDWPALGKTDIVVQGLIEAAVVRLLESPPAIGGAWHAGTSTSVLLHELLEGKGASQAREALRGDQDFTAAVGLVRAFERGGGVLGWELARLVEDAEWKKRAAEGIDPDAYLVTEALARIRPGGSESRFVEILKQARGDAPANATAAGAGSAAPSPPASASAKP